MITKQDLELISTKELRDELCSRYDSGVVIGQQTMKTDSIDYHYFGGKATCMGLCDLIKKQIVRDFDVEKKEII